MKITKDGNYHVAEYDSMLELTEAVVKRNPQYQAGYDTNFFAHSRNSFIGRSDLRSWSDLREAVSAPWAEGMKQVEEMYNDINSNIDLPVTNRRRRCRSEESGSINIDRALSGEADYFDSCRRQPMPGKRNVTVLVNLGGPCKYTAKQLLWRGLAATIVTDILEENGYSVNLVGYHFCTNILSTFDKLAMTVNIKSAEDPMDRVAVLNSMTPWFYRCTIFGSYHLLARKDGDVNAHYAMHGHAAYPESAEKYFKKDKSETYFSMHRIVSRGEAIQAANDVIAQIQSEQNSMLASR